MGIEHQFHLIFQQSLRAAVKAFRQADQQAPFQMIGPQQKERLVPACHRHFTGKSVDRHLLVKGQMKTLRKRLPLSREQTANRIAQSDFQTTTVPVQQIMTSLVGPANQHCSQSALQQHEGDHGAVSRRG